MSVDRTADFRTEIANVRKRKGETKSSDILSYKAQKLLFSETATSLLNGIEICFNFLKENRRDYLNVHKHVSTLASTMTNAERDELEIKAKGLIQKFTREIEDLKLQNGKQGENQDTQAHQARVIQYIWVRLLETQEYMKELREARTEQLRADKERLYPEKFRPSVRLDLSGLKEQKEVVSSSLKFTSEEVQQFEEESKELLDEWDQKLEEIKKSEETLLGISQQMTFFEQKIMEQEEQINSIYSTAVSSTVNIKRGNTQLRQALKRSVDSRVVTLVFLVMAPVCLLFLDWYIP